MSQVALGGLGGVLLTPVSLNVILAGATNWTMNATGESVFAVGKVYLSSGSGTSKTISAAGGGQISVVVGTVTFANVATNLRIGINDVGATGLEDGTHDVYADLVPGTDTITANTINTFTMDTGTKTIADGDTIAVGLEMTARAGADAVVVNGYGADNFSLPYSTQDTGAGPTKFANPTPMLTIKFDDGTYGWVGGDRFAYIPTAATAFGSGSSPDEYALVFQVPFACTLRAVMLPLHSVAAADDFEVIFYTSPLGATPSAAQTITVDADLIGIGSAIQHFARFTPISISANTDYAVAIRPTTANTLGFYYLNFVTAALRTPMWCGTSWRLGSRENQSGAFSETTTQVPAFGLLLSHTETVTSADLGAVQLVNGGLVG